MADNSAQSQRGDGNTTKQMLSAPNDAAFVWNNNRIEYATDLAASLKRDDLKIHTRSALLDRGLLEKYDAVVIDHAVMLTPAEVSRIHSLRVHGMRSVTMDVPEPNLVEEAELRADVMAWNIHGTGLIIRDVGYQVLARLRYSPPPSDVGRGDVRDNAMKLMNRLASIINKEGSVTENTNAAPAIKSEMEPDEALKVLTAFLADANTPKVLKKKYRDALVAVL